MELFPFVVGCMRSGTTLVRAMLDAHPHMAVPYESYFVVTMGRARARYERGARFDTERFVADLIAKPPFQKWGLGEDEVRSALRATPPNGFAAATRVVFARYAESQGKRRYADKTPSYVHHLGLLSGLFPEARFVHVVRDGRDVALSSLDVEFGPDGLGRLALHWRHAITAGRRAGAALGSDRYRELRYEQLVDDPDTTLRALCPFIGLEFEPEMLRYYDRADRVVGTVAHPHRHQRLYDPPTKGLRDWRTQMTPADIELFDALAGDVLDDLGYERADSVGPAARSAARRYRAADRAHRLMARSRRTLRRAVTRW